jgi:hypothetical protein
MLLLFGLVACGKPSAPADSQQTKAVPATAAMSTIAAKPAAMERMIPVPKDKAQLNRMLAMGYTVHEDHMHPPGVKECALDKAGGSVVQ